MSRTTLDLDDPILRDLKRLQKKERKSLGVLASELLAEGLAQRLARPHRPAPFSWQTTRGRVLVDLTDKEALHARLDEDVPARAPRRPARHR